MNDKELGYILGKLNLSNDLIRTVDYICDELTDSILERYSVYSNNAPVIYYDSIEWNPIYYDIPNYVTNVEDLICEVIHDYIYGCSISRREIEEFLNELDKRYMEALERIEENVR